MVGPLQQSLPVHFRFGAGNDRIRDSDSSAPVNFKKDILSLNADKRTQKLPPTVGTRGEGFERDPGPDVPFKIPEMLPAAANPGRRDFQTVPTGNYLFYFKDLA
jgi:hypothetical protein